MVVRVNGELLPGRKVIQKGEYSETTGVGTPNEKVVSKPLPGKVLVGPDPAQLTVTAGYTKNMGNYEALKVSVSVTLNGEKKDLEEMFAWASNFCDDKVGKLLEGSD